MSAQGTIGSLLLVHKPKMVEIRQMKRDKFLPAEADIAVQLEQTKLQI